MRVFFVYVRRIGTCACRHQFVLVSNHVNFLDPFVLAAVLDYRCLQRTYWTGFTGAAFRNIMFRALSRIAQVVPIDQESKAISSLAFGSAVLRREGNRVSGFPKAVDRLPGSYNPSGQELG